MCCAPLFLMPTSQAEPPHLRPCDEQKLATPVPQQSTFFVPIDHAENGTTQTTRCVNGPMVSEKGTNARHYALERGVTPITAFAENITMRRVRGLNVGGGESKGPRGRWPQRQLRRLGRGSMLLEVYCEGGGTRCHPEEQLRPYQR